MWAQGMCSPATGILGIHCAPHQGRREGSAHSFVYMLASQPLIDYLHAVFAIAIHFKGNVSGACILPSHPYWGILISLPSWVPGFTSACYSTAPT